MSARAAATIAVLSLVAPLTTGNAQRLVQPTFSSGPTSSWESVDAPNVKPLGLRLLARDSVPSASTAWSVLASAVIPGSGQALLKQDRFVAYLAVEAYAWARYAADAREGRRARSSYRELASEVARRQFGGLRPVGDFDYYEKMEKFAESGSFDAVPGGDLDPEPDSTTANGAIWLLARQTFWTDPTSPPPKSSQEYSNAATFYRDRAVKPEFQWSWANARLEYAEYRRTIRRSNNAYRTSLQDLGLVIANHALSTVDAFVTVRLRRHVDGGAQRLELFGTLPFDRLTSR